jgi:hypothetical protein
VRGHKRWGHFLLHCKRWRTKKKGRCEKGIQKGSQQKEKEKEKESMYTTKV